MGEVLFRSQIAQEALAEISLILRRVPGRLPMVAVILVLITLQIGNTSPPFGMSIFVMKGTAPWLSLPTIYRSAVPWIISDLVVIVVLALFPWLVTALPSLKG